MRKQVWCKHYNGAASKVCGAGITYKEIGIGLELPCLKPELITCNSRDYYTEKEWEDQEKAITDHIEKINQFMRRETENCLVCGKHVIRIYKSGRCVYAAPCGHRLWQGSIPDIWREVRKHGS